MRASQRARPGWSIRVAVALVVAGTASLAVAQPAPTGPRTKIWYGTTLINPDPVVVPELAPEPRDVSPVFEPPPPLPGRLSPAVLAPRWDHAGSLVLTGMLLQRRIDQGIERVGTVARPLRGIFQPESTRPVLPALHATTESQHPTIPVPESPRLLPENIHHPESPHRASSPPPATVVVEVPQPVASSFLSQVATQMTAILGALVLVLIALQLAHWFLLRRYGVGLFSLFRVEVVGAPSTSPPSPAPASDEAFLAVAAAAAPVESETWQRPEPNFEIGPTYEEERQILAEAERQKEAALLQYLFELNVKIQDELSASRAN